MMGILRKKQARKNSGRPFDEMRFESLIGSVYRRRTSRGTDAYCWTLNSISGTGDRRSVKHSLHPDDLLRLPALMYMLANWMLNQDGLDEALRSDLKGLMTWSSLVAQMMLEGDAPDVADKATSFKARH